MFQLATTLQVLSLLAFLPASSAQSADKGGNCVLTPSDDVQQTLRDAVSGGVSLVQLNLGFQHHQASVFRALREDLGLFQPWAWQRTSSRQGRSLLMLRENFDVLSFFLLSIRVLQLDVTLTSSPPHCLVNMTSQEVHDQVLTLLLNDFQTSETSARVLNPGEQICHREVRAGDEGLAEFVYVCCHQDAETSDVAGDVVCSDVKRDPWVGILMMSVLGIKVLVVLFSPYLLPETVYRIKYATLKYVHHLTGPNVLTLRMLKTSKPWNYGSDDRVVRLDRLPDMPCLRQSIDSWEEDRVHEVTLRHAQMAIKARKLLGENFVPVGLFKILYNNFFLCRLRHLSPLTGCCETNVLGTLNPGLNLPTWFKCARVLARVLLLMILVLPWIIRLLIYYTYEAPIATTKKMAAQEAGLEMPFSGSFTLHLTPLHVLFLVCYVILCLDSLVYGVLSGAVKNKLKLVTKKCLRDMKERSKVSVFGWIVSMLVLPCTVCGLLGILVTPILFLLLSPLLVPLLAFYLFPAINLSIRLLLHVILFVCPAPLVRALKRLWTALFKRLSRLIRKEISFHALTSEETFEDRQSFSKWELPFQVLVILVCLVSFWSVSFLVMELLSFVVEMAVYTFIGLIVTADVTSQYLSVIAFTIVYANRCFLAIHKKYLTYHKALHSQLLKMMRDEIDKIARSEEMDQENTALRVTGAMATPSDAPPVTLHVQNGRLRWRTSSLLLFLDRRDTPYTPERFFFDTVNINYCGCPGELYVNFLRALWSFLKIVIFLLFVFVVVMAFGNAYKVSSTNQLLATAAGGFIPFFFEKLFSSGSQEAEVDPDSVQFQTQFHRAINDYLQWWPVFDISPDDAKLTKTSRQDTAGLESSSSVPWGGAPGSSSSPPSPPTLYPEMLVKTMSEDLKTESEDWEDTTLDVIFDVSHGGRFGSRLQSGDRGSQTMLNSKSNNNEREAGGSARKYRPNESSVNEKQDLLHV